LGALLERSAGAKTGLIVADRYSLQPLADQAHRRAVGAVFGGLVKVTTGYDVRDPFCGTRVYGWELASRFAAGASFGYGLELEQIMIAAANGSPVHSVPVASRRQAEHTAVLKMEENLNVLLTYGRSRLSGQQYLALSNLAVLIGSRASFRIPLDWLGINTELIGEYVRSGEDDEECFALALVPAPRASLGS
jgi:hypothetical protein